MIFNLNFEIEASKAFAHFLEAIEIPLAFFSERIQVLLLDLLAELQCLLKLRQKRTIVLNDGAYFLTFLLEGGIAFGATSLLLPEENGITPRKLQGDDE